MPAFQGQRPDRKQGVGMVMPLYSTEGGIMQGGVMAWPGMTTALEKMVVPAHRGQVSLLFPEELLKRCRGLRFCMPAKEKL